ncbi:MAG: CorA family divalent cation transporter [Janthinobacterium lividum]
MLDVYPRSSEPGVVAGDTGAAGLVWVDLVDPTPDEIAAVERRCHLRVPTRAELSEIESTSRLRLEHGRLYLSAPLMTGMNGGNWRFAPTGFILCEGFLMTVRFDPLPAFDTVRAKLDEQDIVAPVEVFTRLVEELVDRAADHLERAAEVITEAAHEIFADPAMQRRHLSRDATRLRGLMIKIGQASERMSRVRYMFLSVGRMAAFVAEKGKDWLTDGIPVRLDAARHDIASLDEFEDSLTNRVQLLQDAAAGFISIEQNDVVKLLTIVSVVGVPPVLVVGVYGMNFKFMPELNWEYGYPYALALMIVSAVAPLIWFRIRGWL